MLLKNSENDCLERQHTAAYDLGNERHCSSWQFGEVGCVLDDAMQNLVHATSTKKYQHKSNDVEAGGSSPHEDRKLLAGVDL